MRAAALTLALAASLAGGVGSAAAQALTPDQSDVRCLMVLQVVGRDPKQAEQAARGIYFYLGRISSRGPTARLEGLLKAEAPKLAPQQAQTELARCGTELNNRTKELQAVNQRLAAQFAPPAGKAARARRSSGLAAIYRRMVDYGACDAMELCGLAVLAVAAPALAHAGRSGDHRGRPLSCHVARMAGPQ